MANITVSVPTKTYKETPVYGPSLKGLFEYKEVDHLDDVAVFLDHCEFARTLPRDDMYIPFEWKTDIDERTMKGQVYCWYLDGDMFSPCEIYPYEDLKKDYPFYQGAYDFFMWLAAQQIGDGDK